MSDEGFRELAQAIRYVGELWYKAKQEELRASEMTLESLRKLAETELQQRSYTYIANDTGKV